ncbi:MAG: alanine dehydrogenase [Desulfobacterales bacterium]|nr:alanine dehydrogenase [Desulfobacterales bacterium]
MIIGVPKEIKKNEYRVSITPPAVDALVSRGHHIIIESQAGAGCGISDADYTAAGANLAPDAKTVYHKGEMILKVKELFPKEFDLLREGQIIFTYIHSANNPDETQALLDKKVVAIAYEDVETDDGRFPLLTPMSEIAGEVGLIMGVYHMFSTSGGSGIQIGGAVGSRPAKVAILGAGNVGLGAARYAIGLGATVTLLDINLERLRDIRMKMLPGINTVYLNQFNVRQMLPDIDLLINAVKWPPRSDEHIVTREMLKLMKTNSLIVDISCDPAGAIETCVPTSHDEPTYVVEGIRHYCVDNLPSAVARTASDALSNASLPYVLSMADKGWLAAIKQDAALRRGLGFAFGHLTFKPTAIAQNRPYTSAEEIVKMIEQEGVIEKPR